MSGGIHGPKGELGRPPQAVRKARGYPFRGQIVSEFTTLAGKDRVVVDNGDGMLHIYNTEQLIPDHPEHQYLDLLAELVAKAEGDVREDRTGVGTYSVFGRQIRFDLSKGFPLLTTKRVHWKAIVAELLWFLRGDTNVKFLHDHGVTIWDKWADAAGNLGPVYGAQWRSWPDRQRGHDGFGNDIWSSRGKPIDQISNLIRDLKQNPYSRRHVVTAWNPAELPDMALAPCHCLFQFYVEDGKLSCQLYQRSGDIFLGVPFNIASYALLTHLIAREAGLEVGEFVHTFGDVHLYSNHVEQAKEQLTRLPTPFPHLWVDPIALAEKGLFNIEPNDVDVDSYNPHPAIKAPVAV